MSIRNGRQYTSVSLVVDTVIYIDKLAEKNKMTRNALINAILNDYKDNPHPITITEITTIIGE